MPLRIDGVVAAMVAAAMTVSMSALGQAAVEAPTHLEADQVSDHTDTAVRLRWEFPPTPPGEVAAIDGFEISRAAGASGSFEKLVDVPPAARKFIDTTVDADSAYEYRIVSVGRDGSRSAAAQTTGPIDTALSGWVKFKRSTADYFMWDRFWLLVIHIVICGSIIYYILQARKGKALKIRKIAGLEAVEEAVGRATEMGRSIMFIPGIQDMNDIQTIAGITILARVAKTAAEYDAKIEVPTSRSLVMTAARETVQAAYLTAGRPDAYNEDRIYYVTDEQFGYVAYLTGFMVRTKPAACFYMGSFFAESLILAETGNSIGAIQVAGTAQPAQLPFFVASCDYTLIGEEFFAASAYLSGEPDQLGSLKGQDMGKVMVAAFLVIGCIIATFAKMDDGAYLMMNMLDYLTERLLV